MTRKRNSPGPLNGNAARAEEKPGTPLYDREQPPHLAHSLGRERLAQRPSLEGVSPSRSTSDYPPGKTFKPDEETLARRQEQVLEVLKKFGPEGVTRLEVPDYLKLSWPQRISELRSMGYRIDTTRERVCDANIARYVLRSPVPDTTGDAGTQ